MLRFRAHYVFLDSKRIAQIEIFAELIVQVSVFNFIETTDYISLIKIVQIVAKLIVLKYAQIHQILLYVSSF